jgi:hypothetical protein
MPKAEPLRFFVDETSIPLGRAMAQVRGDVVHPGHPRIPEVPPGTLDPIWLPIVGAAKLIVIGRDRHIITKPVELAEYRKHKIRAFWISGDKDLPSWENLTRIVRWWDRMERLIVQRGQGPWFYGIWATTVSELHIRGGHRARPPVVVPRRQPIADPSGQLLLPFGARPPGRKPRTARTG